jgi:hypothetical protein
MVGPWPHRAFTFAGCDAGAMFDSSNREVQMPDGKYINAQWCAEEATNLVMKLQNEGKGDRELLRAVALLAMAVIKLAKKEA